MASSHVVGFSKMEASSSLDQRRSYGEFLGHGSKRSQRRGPRAASTKYNSCSYVLYSNKMEFDTI